MARYKPCDYAQEIVVIVSLEDQLLPGSLEYGIHTHVEQEMDLSIFDQRYKNDTTGCPAYHPKLLLKVVLFAYSHGIVGSRRIEKLCRKHMTCLALAGGYTPDHSTIAAFVSSMHTEILPLFCDILRVCEEQELLGGTVFAVDGMKLPSNASKEWSGTFEDLRHKQEKLEAKVAQLLAEHQHVDGQAHGGRGGREELWEEEVPDEELPEEALLEEGVPEEELPREGLTVETSRRQKSKSKNQKRKKPKSQQQKCTTPKNRKQKSRRQKRVERLKRLRRNAARLKDWLATHTPKIGKQGKEIQSNVTDNASAKMSTSHGVIQGFNAQAVVDAKHQVIVAVAVFGNGQDGDHLPPMVAKTKANMQARGHDEGCLEGTRWLADSNYHSDGNLKTCDEEHLEAYIPDTNFRKRDPRFATQERHKAAKQEKFTLEDFRYDEVSDRYICPNGQALRLEARADWWGSGVYRRKYRRYMARESDCQVCPLRAKCLRQKRTKQRNLGIPLAPIPKTRSQQMIAKIDTEEGRQQYRQRLAIVEPVFANIRTQKRLDHFTLRGKQKVDIQWLLFCMVHNIEKIVHYGEAA